MLLKIPEKAPKSYLYDLMRDYPSRGGKHFRSVLMLLSCDLLGVRPYRTLNTAVALELFHNFALVHDDIEDESLTRRGKPTLHRMHGIPLAINVGDALLGSVYQVLLENKETLGEALTLNVMQEFSKMAQKTFEGQAYDIGWTTDHSFPSKEEYEMMVERKTGWYSGKFPCRCGAITAGGTEQQIKVLGKYGLALGRGFQARDDVLNLISTSEKQTPTAVSGGYGKEQGGDIAEGKRTLIIIEMLNVLKQSDGDRLRSILLKTREETQDDEIAWSIEQAHETGALDRVMDYCNQQASIARDALKGLPQGKARRFMEELTHYLAIHRGH